MDRRVAQWVMAVLLGAIGVFGTAWGEEFVVPKGKSAPVVDGKIEAGEWAESVSFDGFAWQGNLERRRVRGFVAASESHIHVAILSQLPSEGTLVAAVDKDVEKIVFDDSVEVWVDPTPGSEHGATYQLLSNALGRRHFRMHARGNVKGEPQWNGDWRVANGMHAGWWHFEAAIPIASVAPGRKAAEGTWGINLCRNWKQDWNFSSAGGKEYAPGREMVFRFATESAAIHHEHRRDPVAGDVESALVLRNPGASALAMRVVQRLQRDTMPDVLVDEQVELAAGQEQVIPLRVQDRGVSRAMKLHMQVTAGGTVLYERRAAWKAAAGEWVWRTHKPTKPPIDVQFAYYPYLEKMRLLADVSALPGSAKLNYLNVVIRRKGEAKQIKAVRLERFDANGRQETEFELPGLEGAYELVVSAVGEDVPTGEVIKSFDRRRYEWEHNNLGKSRTVYAPFTPLKVEGQTLRAVLREHRLNGLGLWDQVVATSEQTGVSKPVLASPMRYMVKLAGMQHAARPVEMQVSEADGARVITQSTLEAGPLKLASRGAWDVDGMNLVELTLMATKGQAIEELVLEIPFRDEAAPLMHAMAEGIRDSILSQAVPSGEGIVWDASKLPVQELPKNFCTYIYVGGPVRGVCFFAENDRNWSWDPGKPNIELVRQGGVLVLRVHLINKPIAIEKPRTIRFGLQAAPIKPRLGAWRYRYYRDRYTMLGTDINWLALGDCGSVYPAGKDLYLWEMLKRGNRERLPDAAIQEVIGRGRKYFEPYGKERVDVYAAHVRHNLRSRYGGRMVFYYNRASYQLAEEFQTFEDEWALTDYRSVGAGKGIGEIKIVPSESYIDHALWWYGKSFDVGGNQGVYWDNWFIVPSQNTQMTGAYRRADGAIMPAAGMMGLRELCKRTFQYMNERGMVPITMPHMTSTNILPMHGFATVQYDWEWKYSEGDVQYRFPREYLLLVSNGELAGTWPVLLGEHGKLSNDPWTQRTFAAVSIVHELDPQVGNAKVWKPLIDPIIGLLDEPRLQVYRYWDERPQPASANHRDLPAIVYSVPGQQAIVAVTSYAEQDVHATLTIDAKALGFDGEYVVKDVESGEVVPVRDGRVEFQLKKHDIREFRITAGR